jgi:hypothetical protein
MRHFTMPEYKATLSGWIFCILLSSLMGWLLGYVAIPQIISNILHFDTAVIYRVLASLFLSGLGFLCVCPTGLK